MSDTIKKINALLVMMKENDIVELELEEGEFSVALRKQGAFVPAAMPQMPMAMPMPMPMPVAPAPVPVPAAAPVAGAGAEADSGLLQIKSPIVGTFYRASSPDAEPYVQEGGAVRKDTVVCIIEAMKIMNEVRAELDGKIERILVESGEPVEYGQPLFLVRRG